MKKINAYIILASVSIIWPLAAPATVFYSDDFEQGIRFVGKDNQSDNGGFISYLGGEINGGIRPGDGTQDFTKFTNVILDNSAEARNSVPGSNHALKTQYRAGFPSTRTNPGFGYAGSFNLNTTIISFPETDTVYVRWYQKWSANWTWPADQQKFIKLVGRNQSQNFKVSFGNNHLNLTKKSPPPNSNINETYVYSELKKSTFVSDWTQADNDPRTTNYPLDVNRWYCVEVMVKSNTIGKNDAEFSAWIDNNLIFNLTNSFNRDTAGGISHIELQHVVQDVWDKLRTVDTPTWMDNIIVADRPIGCVDTGSPPVAPFTPRVDFNQP